MSDVLYMGQADYDEVVKMQEEKKIEAEREAYLQRSTANYLQNFINGIADSVNTPCIPTGFKKLDAELDGGLFPGLYLVGGVSSIGKTTFTITNLADQIASAGYSVCVFQMEMSRAEMMAKSISRLTLLGAKQNGINQNYAKTTRGITMGSRYRNYNDKENLLIRQAIEAYGQYANQIYIYEGYGDIKVNDMKKVVNDHIKYTGKKPVVIVDYLQILAQSYKKSSDKANVDTAVLELKRLSRDFNIPVIAISSFNRENYSQKANSTAFKESGSIEYSSDVLIALQFKETGTSGFDVETAKANKERNIEAIILKNRNGQTGSVIDFKYYTLFNYFREI